MAERHRSSDGRSETSAILGNAAPQTAGQQRRAGGELQRKVATRDDGKRYDETSSGATRPLNQDKTDSGDKEKV
ncbi:hypothetical protein P775_27425 [Puniceibacterium antarcticum]|uniref:Uncharacterized protein n=1 Tax=Puniceibacterium antarcticum TaxID=1206336 RepID=A0A2G8QWN3_9RHOB|nr:hypothetical protein [Puniceibacterium antarcticum]PIL13697.1 hypothetical protein P775_27425 [Puniceibacterium antarcticum]